MDTKTTGIVAYITWVGLLIAFLAGDKEGAKFHINQSLVLVICGIGIGVVAGIAAFIPVVGWILSSLCGVAEVVLFVFTIMGIVSAVNGEEKPLPIVGNWKIIK